MTSHEANSVANHSSKKQELYKSVDLDKIVKNIAVFLGPSVPKTSSSHTSTKNNGKISKQSKMIDQLSTGSKTTTATVPTMEEKQENLEKTQQDTSNTTSSTESSNTTSEQEEKLEIVHDVLQRIDLANQLDTLDL